MIFKNKKIFKFQTTATSFATDRERTRGAGGGGYVKFMESFSQRGYKLFFCSPGHEYLCPHCVQHISRWNWPLCLLSNW